MATDFNNWDFKAQGNIGNNTVLLLCARRHLTEWGILSDAVEFFEPNLVLLDEYLHGKNKYYTNHMDLSRQQLIAYCRKNKIRHELVGSRSSIILEKLFDMKLVAPPVEFYYFLLYYLNSDLSGQDTSDEVLNNLNRALSSNQKDVSTEWIAYLESEADKFTKRYFGGNMAVYNMILCSPEFDTLKNYNTKLLQKASDLEEFGMDFSQKKKHVQKREDLLKGFAEDSGFLVLSKEEKELRLKLLLQNSEAYLSQKVGKIMLVSTLDYFEPLKEELFS